MAKFTLKLNDHWILSTLMNKAEDGLEDLLNDIAAKASAAAPVGKDRVRKNASVTFSYTPMPSKLSNAFPDTWRNPETGGTEQSWASNVQTHTAGRISGDQTRAWLIEAWAPSKSRSGKEVKVPLHDVRFTRKYKGKPGRAIYDHKHLKDSLKVNIEGEGLLLIGTVTADRPYAYYVDQGTVKMAANPFLSGALAGHQAEIQEGTPITKLFNR